jgi:hypothetical protein
MPTETMLEPGAGVDTRAQCAGGWSIVKQCAAYVGTAACNQGTDSTGAPVRCTTGPGGMYLVPDCGDCHP